MFYATNKTSFMSLIFFLALTNISNFKSDVIAVFSFLLFAKNSDCAYWRKNSLNQIGMWWIWCIYIERARGRRDKKCSKNKLNIKSYLSNNYVSKTFTLAYSLIYFYKNTNKRSRGSKDRTWSKGCRNLYMYHLQLALLYKSLSENIK